MTPPCPPVRLSLYETPSPHHRRPAPHARHFTTIRDRGHGTRSVVTEEPSPSRLRVSLDQRQLARLADLNDTYDYSFEGHLARSQHRPTRQSGRAGW